jgi:hypothetical protein
MSFAELITDKIRDSAYQVANSTDRSVIFFILGSIFIAISAISRLSIYDDELETKIVNFGVSCLVAAYFWWLSPWNKRIKYFLILVILFLIAKWSFAMVVASFRFNQLFFDGIVESRFGILLAAMPIAYAFLAGSSDRILKACILGFCMSLIVIDLLVFADVFGEFELIIGQRTDTRYVLSCIFPMSCSIILLVRGDTDRKNHSILFLLPMLIIMFAHVFLASTSRSESALVIGLIAWAIVIKWAHLRPVLFLTIVLTIIIFPEFFFDIGSRHSASQTGRDFDAAIKLMLDGLPFGLGMAKDITLKESLIVDNSFFTADYGILVYVIRYGLFGVIFILAIAVMWIKYVNVVFTKTPGAVYFLAALSIYLVINPIIEYGGLGGSFFLAALLIQANFYDKKWNPLARPQESSKANC